MKKKIGVLISGGGTNLQAILDAVDSGIIKKGYVDVVISSNKDAYGLERAKKQGIQGLYIDNENEIIRVLQNRRIDLVVLAGYLKILTKDFIKAFENRILNIHPSLIPSFCGKGYYGLKVHEKALEYGVKVSGATVHFVNEIPDGGKIISQRAVEIIEGDTPKSLQKRIMEEAEWTIYPLAVEKVLNDMDENS